MTSPIRHRLDASRRAAVLCLVLCGLVLLAGTGLAGAMPAMPAPAADATDADTIWRPTRQLDVVLDGYGAAADDDEISGPAPTPPEVAVAVALEQVGKPYRTAAKGPDRFDCSGLTGFAWAAAGVTLPPSSRTQYAGLPRVDLDELQPGDLVFRGSPIHHVGMYIGDGEYVHSPRSGETVRVEPFDPEQHVGAVRPWVA